MVKVKLNQIIEGMEIQFEEEKCFLNLSTGEIVVVSNEALSIVEEEEEINYLPEWQQNEVDLANDIVGNWNNYVKLPTLYDINEYNMMEKFCYSLSNNKAEKLLDSIRGRGAFRNFKDKIIQLGIEQQWYEYRNNGYKKIAIEFCESNDLEYIE